jgi:hypothetical protein
MDERERGADEETLDLDAGEFARAWDDEGGAEAGLGGGAGDLGAGRDLSGDLGGPDPERDEGTPA